MGGQRQQNLWLCRFFALPVLHDLCMSHCNLPAIWDAALGLMVVDIHTGLGHELSNARHHGLPGHPHVMEGCDQPTAPATGRMRLKQAGILSLRM